MFYFCLEEGTCSCFILINIISEIQIRTPLGNSHSVTNSAISTPPNISTKPVCLIHSFRLQTHQNGKSLPPERALRLPPQAKSERSSPQFTSACRRIYYYTWERLLVLVKLSTYHPHSTLNNISVYIVAEFQT